MKATTRRLLLKILLAGLALVVLASAWLVWPYWGLIKEFGQTPTRLPSRLFGVSPVLVRGQALGPKGVATLLESAGYRPWTGPDQPGSGFYRPNNGLIEVRRQRLPSPAGWVGNDLVRIGFRGQTIQAITINGAPVDQAYFDPPLIASFYGADVQDRWPIDFEELPSHVIWAILAAEDSSFYQHPGVSFFGILRAAWTNLVAGEVRQGGSTLTQQLVKNIYLSPERAYTRKAREAALALLIDWRIEKNDILEAYLNAIYWGRAGSVNLMGLGAASRAYFGKAPNQLTLAEAALLAGMIQSPARLSPLAHPEASKARRDVVLARLVELEWISLEQAQNAAAEPVKLVAGRLIARKAPYFADAMAEEARKRFSIQALDDSGYSLLSTLDPFEQRAAEAAVGEGLVELEKGPEKSRAKNLQAALLAVDPKTGAIRAYVGGRDYTKSQFDRVGQARRQAGSSFKPVIFAAAFERRLAHPATLLEDAPYSVTLDGKTWSPQNNDDEFLGTISARVALEKSRNTPTARLAVEMGMNHVVEMSHRLGIESSLDPYPALALGAMEVSPRELAAVYTTFASGGLRRPIHGLVAVLDGQGNKVAGTALPKAKRALGEDVAFLITKMLQGVIENGSAAKVRELGLKDPVAGKTGTTNSRRDSWFAGYSNERATLVWVGYDDNAKTKLSGSTAALPIWTQFMSATRPVNGYRDLRLPDGVVVSWVDPRTGGLADESCSQRQQEFFLSDFVPEPACADRGGRVKKKDDKPNPFERLLDIFRGKKKGG